MKKMMKYIMKIFGLVIILLISACEHETLLTGEPDDPGDISEDKVRLEIFARANSYRLPSTRALGDENTVEMTPWVLVFRGSGTGAIFVEAVQAFEFAVTDNDSWEEWSGKIYPADPAYYNFTIKGASKEKYKIVVDGMTTYQFINVDGEWYYDVNADGEIDEAEMDKRDIESSYYYPEIIFLSDGRVAMQMEITLNYTEEDDVNTYYGWPAKGSLAINIFYTRK